MAFKSLLLIIMALLILSININGLRNANKRVSFLHWLNLCKPDIVCLQELHLKDESEATAWFSASGYSFVASPGSQNARGVAILYRPSLSAVRYWKNASGRFVMVELEATTGNFRVANIYAPNRNPERNSFLDEVSNWVDPTTPTFLCGDFNSVFDPSLDRRGSLSLASSYRESCGTLKRLFQEIGVIDIWRHINPLTSAYTWTSPDATKASRIDMIGCPQNWIPSVAKAEIVSCPYTDHDAVSVFFSIPTVIPRGRGYWRLNTSILEEPAYIELVASFWATWRDMKPSYPTLQSWWDVGKFKIKSLTIRYCTSRLRDKKARRCELTNQANTLKTQIDNGRTSVQDAYKAVMSEITSLDLEEAKGAQIRSRARWCEEGETSSAYFLRLEKKRQRDSHIDSIRLPDKSITSDLSGLLDGWTDFYKSLFRSVSTDPVAQADLLSKVESVLDVDDSELCEGSITLDEAYTALKGMAHGKTPGIDGLPMEFYLAFWSVLGTDVVDVLNRAHNSETLSTSQRRGLITLIFKKGDRLNMANWRPITLLNVDYKIASRTIAGRLLKVIGQVVSRDQTCGVPGRHIGENVRLLQDAVAYANEHDVPLAILSLDQEKAFDRVEWPFLLATLRRMGFGPSFIRWVSTFYMGPQSAVNVNGHITEFFTLSRGVRQGCPLSPLLYILVAEVLACNIRASTSITGLTLPGMIDICLLSQYADDTSLLLCTDESIREVFKIYDKYERASGAKLNPTKSKGLWAGSWRGRTDPPVDLMWSSEKLYNLGVYVGNDNQQSNNWQPRLQSFENVLSSWRQRSLSFRGKALVSNALALSGLWYLGSLLPMPQQVLKDINKTLFEFFWSGKKELVARNVVCQPLSSGGFALVNVAAKIQALHVQWVRRYLSSPTKWSMFLSRYVQSAFDVSPDEVLARPNIYALNLLPPFYESVFSTWESIGGGSSASDSMLFLRSTSSDTPTLATNMTAKLCYNVLLGKLSKPAHCVGKFLPVYGSLYWSQTWEQVSICPIDRQVIDLNWKIAHGVLYTASRLASFGYAIDSSCFCGYPNETLPHLFFDCPLAQSVIAWVQSLLLLASPDSPPLVVRHMLFGFNPVELRLVFPVFVYLLNVSKRQIWLARNDYRFRGIRPGAVEVIAATKSRLKFILPLLFKRFHTDRRKRLFTRLWCAPNVIANVAGSSLVFVL